MSQSVGQVFKSRIPTLGDEASIEEALKVYHYGVDNYTIQSIPDDSIEGNFRSLNNRVTSVETTLSGGLNGFVTRTSLSSSPNIITAENVSTVPITVRAIVSQTSNLQQWQNSSNANVAIMSTAGSLALSSYLSLGSTTTSTSVAASINIINSSHKGIVVRSATSQSANLQEWQNSSGVAVAWITPSGELSAEKIDGGTP